MSTIAVRASAVLLATLLAAVVYHTVLARSAEADVRPARPSGGPPNDDKGKSHRPVIGSGVKLVKNADGTVTRVR